MMDLNDVAVIVDAVVGVVQKEVAPSEVDAVFIADITTAITNLIEAPEVVAEVVAEEVVAEVAPEVVAEVAPIALTIEEQLVAKQLEVADDIAELNADLADIKNLINSK